MTEPAEKPSLLSSPARDKALALLADLARAKALFQQRAIMAVLTEGAPQSKPDQERGRDATNR